MVEILGTIFGSIFSGGATGLIGVALQRWMDYKNKQLDLSLEKERRETELAKRRLDAEIMKEEAAGRLKVAQEESFAARDVAETKAFAETLLKEPPRYSSETGLTPNQQWVMVVLDAFRGAVRPALTIYLCALTTYVWIQVRVELADQNLSAEAALDVWRLVVGQILYLTTTVTLWWFGTRNKMKQPGS